MHETIPKGNMGYDQYTVPDTVAVEPTFVAFFQLPQTYVRGLSYPFFKLLWTTVNSKPPTMPFGIVACTFCDIFSRNSCIQKPNAIVACLENICQFFGSFKTLMYILLAVILSFKIKPIPCGLSN